MTHSAGIEIHDAHNLQSCFLKAHSHEDFHEMCAIFFNEQSQTCGGISQCDHLLEGKYNFIWSLPVGDFYKLAAERS